MGVLDGSAVGRALIDAHERGAILAGCSAGAMVLAGHAFDFRVRLVPWPLRWRPGLGLVAGASVVPHYDAWPEPLSALIALQAPRGSLVLGIDEETAVVGRDGHGRSMAGRGSPSGAAATATATEPARRSGSSGRADARVPPARPDRPGQSGRTVRKQSEQ